MDPTTFVQTRDEVLNLTVAAYSSQWDSQATQALKDGAKEQMLRFLFGRIAISSASRNTIWPDVEITSEDLQIGMSAASAGPPSVAAAPVSLIFRVNFNSYVKMLIALSNTSTNPFVKNKTLRQMCMPFAKYAYGYLSEMGYATWAYEKMPKLCRKAKWVAFDFASGLLIDTTMQLNDDEKTVIQGLGARLFKTQQSIQIADSTMDGEAINREI
uniref:Coat protein n=1 Tax=Potato virus T TaxID=36403 RepID=K9MBR2_9VIRU|nr:coat protein [Potato virus T]